MFMVIYWYLFVVWQPEIHYFLANVLAAKGNLTGATNHYKQALLQEPEHDRAYASIRTLKCYDKFHRTAQSAAPKQASPADGQEQRPTCTKSCTRNPAAGCYGNAKQYTDSRLICKTVSQLPSCEVLLNYSFVDVGYFDDIFFIPPTKLYLTG